METRTGADRRGQGTVLILRKARTSIFKRIWIHVDDEKYSKIAEDECVCIPLSPGPHTLRVSQDWHQSDPISLTLSEGETLYLVCYAGIDDSSSKFNAHVILSYIFAVPLIEYVLRQVSLEVFEAEQKDKYPVWKKASLLTFCVLALGTFIFYLL